MFHRLWKHRIGLALLAAALALAGLLSFPQGRQAAAQFLSIFREPRPQSAQPDLNTTQNLRERGLAALLANEVEMETIGAPAEGLTLESASQLAGFTPRLPAAWGESPELRLQPGFRLQAVIDRARLQGILDEIGQGDILLPEEIDGAAFAVEIQPAVEAAYGRCDEDANKETAAAAGEKTACALLVQLPRPVVRLPTGLDADSLATVFMQLSGMSRDEARRFLQVADWSVLMAAALPTYGEARQVSVDGVAGMLLDPGYARARLALVWEKEGMLYVLMTTATVEDALAWANSLP